MTSHVLLSPTALGSHGDNLINIKYIAFYIKCHVGA